MAKLNSTFSGGYYTSPDFDAYRPITKREREKADPAKALQRKQTHMLELSLQCLKCKCFIARMTKVNCVVEPTGEKYLAGAGGLGGGFAVFRLTFKCPGCSAPISVKTDPKSRGYVVESGATSGTTPWQKRMIATAEAKDTVAKTAKEKELEDVERRIQRVQSQTEAKDRLYDLRSKEIEREERSQALLAGGVLPQMTRTTTTVSEEDDYEDGDDFDLFAQLPTTSTIGESSSLKVSTLALPPPKRRWADPKKTEGIMAPAVKKVGSQLPPPPANVDYESE